MWLLESNEHCSWCRALTMASRFEQTKRIRIEMSWWRKKWPKCIVFIIEFASGEKKHNLIYQPPNVEFTIWHYKCMNIFGFGRRVSFQTQKSGIILPTVNKFTGAKWGREREREKEKKKSFVFSFLYKVENHHLVFYRRKILNRF